MKPARPKKVWGVINTFGDFEVEGIGLCPVNYSKDTRNVHYRAGSISPKIGDKLSIFGGEVVAYKN